MGNDWKQDVKVQPGHTSTETVSDARSSFAILIGINQYHSFQPLSYAVADALALQNFLVHEAGFPPEQCLLLTDSSPSVWGRSTYPTREILSNWIERFCRQYVNSDATVWCFFCGHGIHYQGQDYLLPIDAKPEDILRSGIAVQSLFDNLQAAGAKTALVLLDINHNQVNQPTPGINLQSNQTLGNHTSEVAQKSGISTFLASRPGEFSCESSELRQGFFTAALLEGLRGQQGYTVHDLEQYLNARLPKLTDDYWRPIQHPVCIIDGTAETHPPILPGKRNAEITPPPPLPAQTHQANGRTTDGYVVPVRPGDQPTAQAGPVTISHDRALAPEPSSLDGEEEIVAAKSGVSAVGIPKDPGQGQRLKTVASGLQPAVYNSLLNQLVGNAHYPVPESQTNGNPVNGTQQQSYPASQPEVPPPALSNPEFKQATWNTPSSYPRTTHYPHPPQYTDISLSAQQAVEVPEGLSVLQQLTNSHSSPSPTMPSPDSGGSTASETQTPRPSTPEPEISELEDQTFRGRLLLWTGITAAALFLGTVLRNQSAFHSSGSPTASPNPSAGSPTLALAGSGSTGGLKLTRPTPSASGKPTSALQVARATLPNQPQKFRSAIDRAKQIRPNDPQYAQAQVNIERWSWVIVDLAEGRAVAGDYPGAIAAARLVPSDQTAVFARAQQLIPLWQQLASRQAKQALLKTAERQIVPGRASSYNQAIRIATQIQPTDPSYKQAQQRIDTWSQEILAIANRRVRQRSYRRAIEAAKLVPPDTSAYPSARRLIQQLQRRL